MRGLTSHLVEKAHLQVCVRTISLVRKEFESLAEEVKDSLKEIAFLATPGTVEPTKLVGAERDMCFQARISSPFRSALNIHTRCNGNTSW